MKKLLDRLKSFKKFEIQYKVGTIAFILTNIGIIHLIIVRGEVDVVQITIISLVIILVILTAILDEKARKNRLKK